VETFTLLSEQIGGLLIGLAASLLLLNGRISGISDIVGGLLVARSLRPRAGHGLCGIARLSKHSIAATSVFFRVAMLTVFLTQHVI
jgi:uncharacterized membrane protein YedE/YeeE